MATEDPPVITLTISGPFQKSDVAAFLKLLRYIDRHNPEGQYTATIEDPGQTITVAEAEAVTREALSPEDDREIAITIIRKQ